MGLAEQRLDKDRWNFLVLIEQILDMLEDGIDGRLYTGRLRLLLDDGRHAR